MKREDINEVKSELFLNGAKNDNAPRHVGVSNKLIKILLNYISKRPASINGYIFTHAGQQITNSTVNKAIKTACASLDIKRNITSHAFRHTHASYLIHKDVNIYYISKRLGHSDISVTLNKYGHLLKEA
ncbi:tyrosine-type recombinase/integrase [Staphylococcus felis]|nr:tyrosine-type recombinase/integrase [Staphylococcus felis]